MKRRLLLAASHGLLAVAVAGGGTFVLSHLRAALAARALQTLRSDGSGSRLSSPTPETRMAEPEGGER